MAGGTDLGMDLVMTPEDLKQRTFEFGRRVIAFAATLLRTPETRAIGEQLIRCGPAVGANYRAACCARSRAEFVARLGIVIEEADESDCWLSQALAGPCAGDAEAQSLRAEAIELRKIVIASKRTAERRHAARLRVR